MDDRGFGLELEYEYGESVAKTDFDLDWWSEADTANFSMNGSPVTKRGSSRMVKRARAGILKPSGSTEQDADLQRIGHFFRGFLDNYVHTAPSGSGTIHTHEFYGGEGKHLQSFRGITMKDFIKKYLFGMLIDTLKLEVSDDSLKVSADWIYKTEKAGVIGESSETFTKPDDLDDDLFIMFYDITVKLNNKNLLGDNGIVSSISYEGKNNLAQNDSIGMGARYPQQNAVGTDRENSTTLVMTLTKEIVHDILNAEYGEVGALEMSSCKLLQIPLEFNIALCEHANQALKVVFPKCTVGVTYDNTGTESIKVNLSLESLGAASVTMADGTTSIVTDMYVKLENKQGELVASAPSNSNG